MEVKIEIPISLEIFENILITALEGGSNYWYLVKDDVPKIPNKAWAECVAHHLYNDPQFKLNIYDLENEDEILGELTQAGLLKALNKKPNELLAVINETYDACDADTIFQTAIMGEVAFG